MKKYLLGIFALFLAVGLSAFTNKESSLEWRYYWYRQSDHTLIADTETINENPLECEGTGSDCVKVWLLDYEPNPEIEPSEPAADAFSFTR